MPATEPAEPSNEPVHPKPLLRGRIHQFAFFAAIPAALLLLMLARPAAARVAAGIYGISVVALFGTSAAYHRLRWTARALARMRRLDHSMIYILIAGTYAPFVLLVLDAPWSTVLLSLVGGGAIAGILIQVFAFHRLRVVTSTLYIVLGWLVLLAAPELVQRLRVSELVPLVVGGVLYTAGAITLATKKPNPNPRVFGYHEVFHLSTVVAAICHYTSVLLVVVGAR
ncbi:MAG: PAQR family membrane homeostasis protein TrhA [Actinomycetota bacterium]